MELASRELQVLTTIVENYIACAEPIGSRTVARESGLNLSAASMRNTMADLTEKGYLEQPHASAGRIPTAKAFRCYLDTVLRAPVLDDGQQRLIKTYMGGAGLEITDILRQTSRLLSALSRQVSMVLAPGIEDARWMRIDFVQVRSGLIMSVLVLEGGMAQNKLIKVKEHIPQDDLVKFANYLNHHFEGKPLSLVKEHILRELKGAEKRLNKLYRRALILAGETFEPDPERDFFVDGALNMLDHPEFSDLENIRELLHFLEERSRLLELLGKTIGTKGIKITLGRETQCKDLKYCSVISSPYGDRDQSLGVVGIMGPLRMDYSRVVPLVDFTARMLTKVLKNRF